MALNALTLAVTTGVQGYPFRAAIAGLTAGSEVTLGSDTTTQGGGVLNGVLDHPALPFDGSNTFVVNERAPNGETRITRLEITGISRRAAFAIGDAALSGGRTAVARRIVGTQQPDRSLVWSVAVTDDLGAEIVVPLASGGGTPTFPLPVNLLVDAPLMALSTPAATNPPVFEPTFGPPSPGMGYAAEGDRIYAEWSQDVTFATGVQPPGFVTIPGNVTNGQTLSGLGYGVLSTGAPWFFRFYVARAGVRISAYTTTYAWNDPVAPLITSANSTSSPETIVGQNNDNPTFQLVTNKAGILSAEGTHGGLVSINQTTKVATLVTSPDYETLPAYSITFVLTDFSGRKFRQAFTWNISDLFEPAPLILDATRKSAYIALSAGNKLGTNSGASGSYSNVRVNQNRTGRRYYELVFTKSVIDPDGASMFGIVSEDYTDWGTVGTKPQASGAAVGFEFLNNYSQTVLMGGSATGVNEITIGTWSNSDVWQIDNDEPNHQVRFGRNGSWGAWRPAPASPKSHFLFASLVWDAAVRIRTTAGECTLTKPAGALYGDEGI
ncbi:MAG: hypothetical protein V4530_05990 [Pseudomonadota bacterium]